MLEGRYKLLNHSCTQWMWQLLSIAIRPTKYPRIFEKKLNRVHTLHGHRKHQPKTH